MESPVQTYDDMNLGDHLKHLDEHYDRLVLTSHFDHAADFFMTSGGENTLIVTSNWLQWREQLAEGRDCLQFEAGWEYGAEKSLNRDLYLRAIDWIFVNREDVTEFRGVSLGQLIVVPVSRVIREYHKITGTLSALIERFRPKEIVYYDCRDQVCYLDADARAGIAAGLALRAGARFVDRRNPPDEKDESLPPSVVPRAQWRARRLGLNGLAKHILSHLISALSLPAAAAKTGRPRVLMLTTHLLSVPLIKKFDGEAVAPVMLAEWFPRKTDPAFLFGALKKGFYLISRARRRLPKSDAMVIRSMARRLSDEWVADPADGCRGVVREYLRRHVLNSGWMEELAADVIRAEMILNKSRPAAVVADGWEAIINQCVFALAQRRGIATILTWHGQWINDQKLPIQGGDPRKPSSVSHYFTWGAAHEKWLDSTFSKGARHRTGNVICKESLDSVQNMKGSEPSAKRVLLLQYDTTFDDITLRLAEQFDFLVNSVRMLKKLGYGPIKIKLHPGVSREAYHKKIAALMDLDCEIIQAGPFVELIDWADVVIGPVISGAMIEVLARGKPYLPVLLGPHAANLEYLTNGTIFTDVGSLADTLETHDFPSQDGLLEDYSSLGEIPDPARAMWSEIKAITTP